jgi:hypothetical protein
MELAQYRVMWWALVLEKLKQWFLIPESLLFIYLLTKFSIIDMVYNCIILSIIW